MIPIELQAELKRELEELFRDYELPKPDNTLGKINVYEQHLPVKKGKKDDDHYPCILVKLVQGDEKSVDDPFATTVNLMVGVLDETEEKRGHKDVMLILQRIYNHIAKSPIIGKRFEAVHPFKWALTEEDYHPYYYGGMLLDFTSPKMIREDVNHQL